MIVNFNINVLERPKAVIKHVDIAADEFGFVGLGHLKSCAASANVPE